MTHRYIPELHDPILREMNEKWRRTDQEIADEMGIHCNSITYHRTRLGLPRYARPRMPMKREPEPAPPARERPNPLAVAHQFLGARLMEKRGHYWLDGVPVNLDTIMRAVNAVLKGLGFEQVTNCDRWRV